MTFRFADLVEAAAAYENDIPVITVVSSPLDATLWYSECVWRDATYAWHEKRHVKDGFRRMTPEIRALLPDDVDTFSAGENACYIGIEPEPNDGLDGEEWNLDEDPFLREGLPEFNGAFR